MVRYKLHWNRQEENIDTMIVTNNIDPYCNANIKSVRYIYTQTAFVVKDIESFTFDCTFIDKNSVKTSFYSKFV